MELVWALLFWALVVSVVVEELLELDWLLSWPLEASELDPELEALPPVLPLSLELLDPLSALLVLEPLAPLLPFASVEVPAAPFESLRGVVV